MKNKIDYGMALYTFVVACFSSAVRILTSPSIPQVICIYAAVGLVFVGVLLSVWEVKNNLKFFYGSSENWNGYGIVNSACIIGISAYFLSYSLLYAVVFSLLLRLFVIVERSGVRYFVNLIRK